MSRAPLPDSSRGDAPMPSSFDGDLDFYDEGRFKKFMRHLKEEPLIPVGLGLTCYALWGAFRSIRKGNKTDTNFYFRARVYAQSGTLVCIVAGSLYYKEDRAKRKEYQGLLSEKKAKEKRDAWIRELEARDKDDQGERERRRKLKELRRERELEMAEAEESDRAQVNSAMSPQQLRDLVPGSSILGPAMWLWRRRAESAKQHEDTDR
ncbi:MAG: Respiratory supercomplex factor 1, mitochondrial [Chrysothrix sp. TS-e1954]|nr:MAG: Respiratory supercomplex factor 1, mitochondrial [Chrysothrix sp. TS-e1954]